MASTITNLLTGGLLDGVSKVINSIRGKNPEDAAKLEALQQQYQMEFLKAQVEQRQADLQELQMQADVNKVEAANPSVFVAGWRPFIGWICGAALGFQFILRPLLMWIATLSHHAAEVPPLDMGDLITVLLGMLGLGAMRSYDKTKGVASGH